MISRKVLNAWMPWCAGAAAAATLAVGSASAEIGVVIQDPDSSSSPRPYIFGVIVDDPNPFGNIWTRFAPNGATRVVLNPEGSVNGDGRPELLVHPETGLPIAVWSRRSHAGYEIVISRFESGEWTAPQVLSGGSTPAFDPAIAVDPADGSVHVAYWEDGSSRRVLHRSAPADLGSWSAETVVSQAGEFAARPSAVFHDGTLRIAYEVHTFGFGETPRNIVLARREGAGFVPEVLAVTHFAGVVRPEIHSHNGRVWVDWVDSDGELGWTRRVGAGAWETLRYEPYGDATDREFDARARVRAQAIR